MKKTIFLAGLICLLPFCYALSEGQILTQQQLDNVDIETVNLNCQFDRNSFGFVQGDTNDYDFLKVKWGCYDIVKDGDDYEIVVHIDTAKIYFYEFKKWFTYYSSIPSLSLTKPQLAKYLIKKGFTQQKNIGEERIREKIGHYQTNSTIDISELSFDDIFS